MIVRIEPKPLNGTVEVISSKSLSHRYVIAAGLSKDRSVIDNVLDSDDLLATKKALKQLGVIFDGNAIKGTDFTYDGNVVDCHESGSTLRFFIPIFMLLDQEVTFHGKGRLPDRPLDVYKEMFEKTYLWKKQGSRELPLTVKGPLIGGTYHMRGDVSSQFMTGLLFALPLAKEDSMIHLTTPLSSKDYVELTLDVLKAFGIHIKYDNHQFFIKGNQTYKAVQARVEGDFSQAAFFMVAGLIGKPLTLTGLNPSSKQGDQKIVDILKKMQGNVVYDLETASYQITPSVTQATTIDLDPIPDLGPILMVLAGLSLGTTHFKGISRLRLKESDRMEAMRKALEILGVEVIVSGDEAWIKGVPFFKGNVVLDGANDHRIVMALSIASIKAQGTITITHAESIAKSYPTFFQVFKNLGGTIDELK